MELNFNEIRELLAILNQTDIAEITVKSNDFELTVRKDVKGAERPSTAADAAAVPSPAPTAPLAAMMPSAIAPVAPAPVASPSAPPPPSLATEKLVDITSPMVGTFYRSPAPDEPPFVGVGDRIRAGQTVCIIEAMKLMNEIEAEVSGEIVEILVQNAEPVEYGQVLMRVNPG
ncbi:MAG TPA: acetyl-CoA carboxylase biotin carboxyl carrier protein [Synechococcales cyanobacterium M55_K2018_004]|nr:acetyl-CoA carboxylase biotin carboxyl carrier protein [Synechococcales cyanobacterium M55_K2018_004]